MLDLSLDSLTQVTDLYLKAVGAGLVDIYCSNTGLVIGSLTANEMYNFIEVQLVLNPLLSDEDFIDHLQLAMIPVSSRPSPMFQGMTPKRYAALARQFPEQMFRFLAGRLVFERWTHMNGHVNLGGKLEWLKTISHNATESELKEIIDSLIRIDAIFSLRRCFINHELKARLESIREDWPGLDAFASFIFELEQTNITRLAGHNKGLDGFVVGNQMAQQAAIQTAANLSVDELEQAYLTRKKAQALHDVAREERAAESRRRITQAYASKLDTGKTEIRRGADAIIGLAVAQADSQGAVDTEFVKKALATYDFTKTQIRTLNKLANGSVTVKESKNTRTPKVKKAPKIVFDLSLIPTIGMKLDI